MCYTMCYHENYDGECTAGPCTIKPCEVDESSEPDYDAINKDERSEIAENLFIK